MSLVVHRDHDVYPPHDVVGDDTFFEDHFNEADCSEVVLLDSVPSGQQRRLPGVYFSRKRNAFVTNYEDPESGLLTSVSFPVDGPRSGHFLPPSNSTTLILKDRDQTEDHRPGIDAAHGAQTRLMNQQKPVEGDLPRARFAAALASAHEKAHEFRVSAFLENRAAALNNSGKDYERQKISQIYKEIRAKQADQLETRLKSTHLGTFFPSATVSTGFRGLDDKMAATGRTFFSEQSAATKGTSRDDPANAALQAKRDQEERRKRQAVHVSIPAESVLPYNFNSMNSFYQVSSSVTSTSPSQARGPASTHAHDLQEMNTTTTTTRGVAAEEEKHGGSPATGRTNPGMMTGSENSTARTSNLMVFPPGGGDQHPLSPGGVSTAAPTSPVDSSLPNDEDWAAEVMTQSPVVQMRETQKQLSELRAQERKFRLLDEEARLAAERAAAAKKEAMSRRLFDEQNDSDFDEEEQRKKIAEQRKRSANARQIPMVPSTPENKKEDEQLDDAVTPGQEPQKEYSKYEMRPVRPLLLGSSGGNSKQKALTPILKEKIQIGQPIVSGAQGSSRTGGNKKVVGRLIDAIK